MNNPISGNNKEQQIREAILEIQAIMRQRELLNDGLTNCFLVLKNFGYPRGIISQLLKEKKKTKYQAESEQTLLKELEIILGQ